MIEYTSRSITNDMFCVKNSGYTNVIATLKMADTYS